MKPNKPFSLAPAQLAGTWSLWVDDPAADSLFKGTIEFKPDGSFELRGVNSLEHSERISHVKEKGSFSIEGEKISFHGSVWLSGTWLAEITPSKAIVLHSIVNGKPYHYPEASLKRVEKT